MGPPFARTYAIVIAVCGLLGIPTRASAQIDKWEVNVAPLYFWAPTTVGDLAISGDDKIPRSMDFADANSKLAGAFSFYGEAHKGRWSVLGEINFVRLSSDVRYTTPIINGPIAGTLRLDQINFNGRVTFQVKPGTTFHFIGGIRSVTMSPNARFAGPVGSLLPALDLSKTDMAGVGGFIYRPRLGNRVVVLMQADIGDGSAFTWSVQGGVEFLIKPWIGLAAGYSALHIDTGKVSEGGSATINDVQYVLSEYGPAVLLTFHWREK